MNYSNFKLINKKFVEDVNSEVFEFEHEKTKTKLVYLKNDDPNMVFNIGFKTIPKDSTGVPHIIEHSVLCGSEKYPVKEPFVELMKSSLNTFLNAMTFSEKTLYPVASQNKKDLLNLMSVYLDAVFKPDITKYKEIFMQEGWRYELENKEDELTLNGVVYSEMKGASSSPMRVIYDFIGESLFDNTYKYNSGGDPEVIPELTYEMFLDFYHEFYHPSNAMIVLYGDCQLEELLAYIDGEYLSKYEYKKVDGSIKPTAPFKAENKVTTKYSINEEDDEKGKAFFAKNYVIGLSSDEEMNFAMNILQSVLVNSDSSLIKKRLLESGLCGEVVAQFDNYKLQSTLSVIAINADKENIPKINEIIESSIKELSQGIDKKFLEACITNTVFNFKQQLSNNSLKGIDLSIILFNRWSFADDPVEVLYFEDIIKKMYSMAEGNGFEELLKKYFIDNTYVSSVSLLPEKGLAKRKDAELSKKLQEYKKSLSDEQLDKIIAECKALKLRQTTPDSEEGLSKMPVLSLEDIDKHGHKKSVNEEKMGKYSMLHYEKFTNDLIYAQLIFDSSSLNEEEIQYASLLSDILSKIATENYALDDLSNELMINTGAMIFTTSAYADLADKNKVYKQFKAKLKISTAQIGKSLELLEEILFKSKLDDTDRIKQILGSDISLLQMKMVGQGNFFALTRISSQVDRAGYFTEKTKGYSYYQFVKSLSDNFDSKKAEVVANLQKVLKKLLNQNGLIITATCTMEQNAKFKAEVSAIANKLDDKAQAPGNDGFAITNKTEAFAIASNVQYVGMGYNYKELGCEFNGSSKVVSTIMNTDYLWNNIRVLGGAYGAGVRFNENGSLIFSTYRDPNLDKTVETCVKASDFLGSIDFDKTHMDKYIIGTISNIDDPLSVEMEGEAAFADFISHNTYERQEKIRAEVLNTTNEDLRKVKDVFKAVTDKNLYNVFGNSEVIKNSGLKFDAVINVQ